jgi:hypothetical protein
LQCLSEYRSLYRRLPRAFNGLFRVFPYSCVTHRHHGNIDDAAKQSHPASLGSVFSSSSSYCPPVSATAVIRFSDLLWVHRQLLASFLSSGEKQRAVSAIFTSAFNGVTFVVNADDLFRSIDQSRG